MIKFSYSQILAVALGGAFGAILRWAIYLFAHGKLLYGPIWLIAVNTIGCFIAGSLKAILIKEGAIPPSFHAFISTGMLSSLTTFSAVIFEFEILANFNLLHASIFIFTSILLGFCSFKLGIMTYQFL